MLPVKYNHAIQGYALRHGMNYEFPVGDDLWRELENGSSGAVLEMDGDDATAIIVKSA